MDYDSTKGKGYENEDNPSNDDGSSAGALGHHAGGCRRVQEVRIKHTNTHIVGPLHVS